MKKLGFALYFLGLLSLGLTSCSKTDNEIWRQDNVDFFDSLTKHSELLEVGDSINGYPGLFYKVYQAGTGKKPIIGDYVQVIYSGWSWNDTIKYDSPLDLENAFDHTIKPKTFRVGKSLIEGFNIALENMTVGSKWRIYLPYYLGYGTNGTTGVKPYSTLIFDVTLVSID